MMSLLALAGCGDAEEKDVRCDDLNKELLEMIRTDCPPQNSTCAGNPNLDTPVVSYSKRHHDKIKQMTFENCTLADLGQAPLFCNSGKPACPTGYQCCSPNQVCRPEGKACGSAPDGGP